MEYEKWAALSKRLAVEMAVHGMTEMMIPAVEARHRAEAASNAPPGQRPPWILRHEYEAGDVLLALERLGFAVVAPAPR